MSEIVTRVKNGDNQLLCLFPNKTLLSLTDPENQTIEIMKHPSLKIIDEIDLSQSDLDNNQKQKVISLLDSFIDVFAEDISQIGCTNMLTYDIRLKQNIKPIRM